MIFRISKRRIVVAAACELILVGGVARAGQLFWDGGNAPFPKTPAPLVCELPSPKCRYASPADGAT